MKKSITAAAFAGLFFAVAAPALAGQHMTGEAEASKAEVVERDASGKATKVKVGEHVYAVCTPDMSDGCINPRAAGLNFGSVPLDHWPGAPASNLTPQEKMRTAEENAAAAAQAEEAEEAD